MKENACVHLLDERVDSRLAVLGRIGFATVGIVTLFIPTACGKEPMMTAHVLYRTVKVDGLNIFSGGWCEGPRRPFASARAPLVVADVRAVADAPGQQVHLVAPDYPGFGHSDWPKPAEFAYTFDHLAAIMDRFTDWARGTRSICRTTAVPSVFIALAGPNSVQALIIQNAVAHDEGLGPNWKTRQFWTDRAAYESALRVNLLSLDTTRTRHVGDDPHVERYDADLWRAIVKCCVVRLCQAASCMIPSMKSFPWRRGTMCS